MQPIRSRVLPRWMLLTATTSLLTLPAGAQSPPRTESRLNLAFTYQSVYAGRTETAGSFFTQGAAAELDARLHRRFRLVLSVTGEHAGPSTTAGVPLSFISSVIGPRYTFAPFKHTSPFLEAMAGGVSAFSSRFPTSSGLSSNAPTTAGSFAFLAGGGLDVRLRHRIALRAFQADWLFTQLPNASSNRQNNLRIGVGLIVPLGK